MKKLEEKVQQLETQILENHVNKEKEQLLTEMKKIGIEKLPYSYSALKPFIDPETMDFHYNKHYKGYVDKLNDALSKKKNGDVELEQIIKNISRYDKSIRNNAGGAFNHALFWNMLTPNPKKLEGELYKKIVKQFGSFTAFKKKFEAVAKDRFGSGWVWLVLTAKNTLKIMSTPNQDNPLMNVIEGGGFPLLGLDLWEHAYYLKYRNKRDEYIVNFWKVVNWDFVTKMYEMKTQKS
jgi:Fe-Mn family superoxide dismutase